MRFEWDEAKSKSNHLKHGVSFEEAQGVFYDEHALLLDDPEHSTIGDRFVLLGASLKDRLLIVCHCYREDDELIRINSARKANGRERQIYGERK